MVAHNAVDLTNQRFGFLTAVGRAGRHRKKYAMWSCRCDCGQLVSVRSDRLVHGRKKACGVANHRWVSRAGSLSVKFNSEYKSWESMRDRCRNPKNKNYKNYGGRGIHICEAWNEFAIFLENMGPKPAKGYTLERKDVNGHYEPDNCHWATKSEQRRNTRISVFVEYEGKRMLLIDVVAKLGLDRNVVTGRLKMGWSLEQALTVPVRAKKK